MQSTFKLLTHRDKSCELVKARVDQPRSYEEYVTGKCIGTSECVLVQNSAVSRYTD